jgi:selenocysteine lyase/cysteine desulfurase
MRPLRAAQQRGVQLTVVPCSPQGWLDPADVARAIRPGTKALFVLHASNVTGTLMPLRELADLAHGHGIQLCVDASQTAGCVPIDVTGTGIDLLFFTGHKALNGPQGTGGMYLRPGLEAEVAPLILGGTGSRSEYEEQPEFMPDRYESGTPNAIGLAGLGAGIDHLLGQGIAAIRQREMRLTQLLLEGLADIQGVTVHGPGDASRMAGVVSFGVDGTSPSDTACALADRFDILTRPGLHCAPAAHRTLGTFPMGTVRCSLGVFTTEADIRTTLRALAGLPS